VDFVRPTASGRKCDAGEKSSGAPGDHDAATVDAAALEQFHGSISLNFQVKKEDMQHESPDCVESKERNRSLKPTTELGGTSQQLHSPVGDIKLVSATPARLRGPCLTRRTGQAGNVYQPAHPGKWNAQAPCY
jgi:hypothetical protein